MLTSWASAAGGSEPGPRDPRIPVGITPRRFWLWASALVATSAVMIVGAPNAHWVDFPQYWYASQLVGSPDLLDTTRQAAWQTAHGYSTFVFLYPPGTGWLYAPLSLFPLPAAFFVHAAGIWLIGVAIGLLGARTFELDTRVALIATLAWSPVLAAAAVGQNAPLGLLFAMAAIYALKSDRRILAGVAVGLMFYKPTLALPMLGLLVIRRQWTSLAAAMAVAIGWYAVGVAGSAGDWMWPRDWLNNTAPFFDADTWHNANKTVALPGLLMGHGVPSPIAYVTAAAVVLAALPRLLRAPIVEAGAATCLIGIVASPHSLQYEAVMALPLILWAAGGTGAGIAEPWRTRLLVAAYLIVQLYVLTPFLGVSVVALVTLGGAAIWIMGWQREVPHERTSDLAGVASPPGVPS